MADTLAPAPLPLPFQATIYLYNIFSHGPITCMRCLHIVAFTANILPRFIKAEGDSYVFLPNTFLK